MGLFDNLYKQPQPSGDFGATTLPPTPTTSTNPQDDFHRRLGEAMLKLFDQPTGASARSTSGTDFGSLINAMRATPHYGMGGELMTSSNPTGDPRDPFNNPKYFGGNPVQVAAQAINAQPLWRRVNGMLVHGSNYPNI